MPTIKELISEYGESHQNETNKLVHWICVPTIFFTLYGLLQSVRLSNDIDLANFLNLGTILLLFSLVYYFAKSPKLFVGFLLWSLFIWYTCNLLYSNLGSSNFVWLMVILFVAAWIGQFWGHKIEGKKPSFLKDVQFLLIGPAWLLNFIYQKLGINL